MQDKSPSEPNINEEIAGLKQEINSLRLMVETIGKELIVCKDMVYNMSQEAPTAVSGQVKQKDAFKEICDFCLDIVSPISIVRQIHVFGSGEAAIFWAIVDTPLEEKEALQKYEDDIDMLKILSFNLPFDFQVVDIADYPELQKSEGRIPEDAVLIWDRENPIQQNKDVQSG